MGPGIEKGLCLVTLAFGALLATTTRAQAPPEGDLASGPYATMRAKLERTIFDIDVLEVAVRFDPPTQRRLAGIARGHRYSGERANRVAQAAVDAEHAVVRVTFLRDVRLDQYLPGVRDDLRRAYDARLLDRATYEEMAEQVPSWFGYVEGRGFRKGDRLYYDIRPDAVRTVLVDGDGREIAERVQRGEAFRYAVLGSYFAPGTTFRNLLIRSLF